MSFEFFFFSSRRRHTRCYRDWSSDVCSSDLRWSRALAGFFAPFEKKGLKVLGPAAAPLARLRKEFRFQFLLKTTKRSLLTQTLAACFVFCAAKEIPESAILADVDP